MACKWINGQYALGQKYRGRIGQVQKDPVLMVVKRRLPIQFSKNDDFVKHVFREHNKEADHWANIGAEGQRKIVIGKCKNPETWIAVTGYWDDSFKDNGKSRCGVVIKGVNRDRWVTTSRIAIPSKVGTAMEAVISGVCVLTGILDPIFH